MEIINEQKDFKAVWARVTGQAPAQSAQAQRGKDPLPELIALVRENAAFYRAAARRAGQGRCGALLAKLADDSRRLLRRLRALHFMETGDGTQGAAARAQASAGTLRDLREGALRQEALAARLSEAAEGASARSAAVLLEEAARAAAWTDRLVVLLEDRMV